MTDETPQQRISRTTIFSFAEAGDTLRLFERHGLSADDAARTVEKLANALSPLGAGTIPELPGLYETAQIMVSVSMSRRRTPFSALGLVLDATDAALGIDRPTPSAD